MGTMKGTGGTGIPEFQSLQQEKEYWEARGPLAAGHKGRTHKPQPGQKRSSFLVVRLTGEELKRLRDTAAKQGLGPSTFARLVLTQQVERDESMPKTLTLEKLKSALASNLSQVDKDRFEDFFRNIAIGDPDNPLCLVFAGERKNWEEVSSVVLARLLALVGVKVVIPREEDYERVEEIVRREP